MNYLELDIRGYQKLLLEMMKILAEICDNNGINYYLVGGSALGAKRDHGFIKWDNDMDVALPREDYEKLISIADKQLPSNFELRYRINACSYHFVRNDIQVDRSKINESGYGNVGNPYIDVIPIDGAPNNRLLRYIRMTKIIWYTRLHKFSCISRVHEHTDRSRQEIHIIRLAKRLHTEKWIPIKLTTKLWINESKKTKYGTTDWVLIGFGSYKHNDVFPYSWVGEGEMVPFEDDQFRIFSNCEGYLRQLYGNYEVPVKRGF